MAFEISEIDARTRLIATSGKLRGSAAKLLGQQIEELADQGIGRILIDLRDVPSIDSLGAWAIRRGNELGLEVVTIGAGPEVTEELAFAGATPTRVNTLEQALGLVVIS